MRHLRLPVRLTRIGMAAENAVRCFWPVWTIGFVCLAPLMMGWQDLLPIGAVWAFAGAGSVAFLAALLWGLRRFRMPTMAAALARVDAAMPGRPIAAVADVQAIGASDPASIAVWQAHVARMAERTKSARAVEPDLRIADRDPYGLRFIAVLFFVTALLFGSFLRVASVGDMVTGPSAAMASGPIWEGWVEPPAYTGRPSLYLNDIPAGPLRVHAGSKVTLRVYGDANDYVGKGLSGGRIVLRPSDDAPAGYVAEDNIIGGNVILFGATSGEAFIRGTVGERFAVRNSGAYAVVEGVGDHGCEYMTGGKVVILGATGRNFAAGMSCGIAYLYDPQEQLPANLNAEMVDLEELDDDDVEWLRGMLGAHCDATDSAVARAILADWPRKAGDFVKVMPRDYRRVLAAIAEAERAGADVDEAIMAASRG